MTIHKTATFLLVAGLALVGISAASFADTDVADDSSESHFVRWRHAPLVESMDPDDAANKAGRKILKQLASIRSTARKTWYRHKTKVNRRSGTYAWDCSGMTTWILERTAPRARKSLNRDRPVATTFLKAMQRAPTDKPRRGWQQIADIEDLRPGDIFAWKRPKEWGKGVTGHVGFVVSRPQPLKDVDNAYVVRIVDSTRYPHGDDTRGPDETGFGLGTVLFVTDDSGKPTAYGWHGAESRGAVTTQVAFGRVSR